MQVSNNTRRPPAPSAASQRGLDCLNFFVADVQTGFGPFLAVYLTINGWDQGVIGSVLTVSTVAGVLSQIPAGALVDWVRTKRAIIAVSLGLIAAGALLIAFFPTYPPVLIGELLHGVTGGAVRVTIAAVGLGLVGHRAYNERVGRNHRYDSLGNATTAAAMGALGYLVSPRAPFFAAAGLCVPAIISLGWIRRDEIDYARARGAAGRKEPTAAHWKDLVRDHRLVVFACCIFLFQFANASILLLGAERLAAHFKYESELVTSAMVVVPQALTGIIATWVGRRANEWGRKPFLLAGFAAVLARTCLFAIAPGPWYLVPIQALDGITAAVLGIMTPLVLADLTRGTGRYNFTLGALGTISMAGASLSTTAVGFVAQMYSFFAGFSTLAVAALAGLALLWWAMPETMESSLQAEE